MTKLTPLRTWRACPLALLFVFGCGESADGSSTAETADDAASSAGSAASAQNVGNAGAGSGEGAGLGAGAGSSSDPSSVTGSPGAGGASDADPAMPSGAVGGSSGPPGTDDGQAAVPPGVGAADMMGPATPTDESTAGDSTASGVDGADEQLADEQSTDEQLADDEFSDDDATDTVLDDSSDTDDDLGGDDSSDTGDDLGGDDMSAAGDDASGDDDASDDMSEMDDDDASDDMSEMDDDAGSDDGMGNDNPNQGAACTGVSGDFGVVGSTIIVQAGQTYDGQCQRFVAGPALGDGSQSESQDPVFRLEQGARLLNVVLGSPAADGIHVYGDARLSNIVWEDVGEDALTIKESGEVILDGGSARDGEDKIFQVNAAATFRVSNFTATNGGKFIRQNGGTTYQVDVFVDGCDISNMNESIFRTDSNSSSLTLSNTRYSNIGEVFRRGDDRGASYNDAGGNSSY